MTIQPLPQVVEPAARIKSDLLTREEAATYLGIAPATLATWACTHRYALPLVKIGRSAKYRQRDLDAFIERRTTNPGEVAA